MVADVAAILNQQTVRNRIDAAKLPALHVGRRVRIRANFDALFEPSVIGERQPALPSIWDGEMSLPKVPADHSGARGDRPNLRAPEARQ
jgi:hypothetical protein